MMEYFKEYYNNYMWSSFIFVIVIYYQTIKEF